MISFLTFDERMPEVILYIIIISSIYPIFLVYTGEKAELKIKVKGGAT